MGEKIEFSVVSGELSGAMSKEELENITKDFVEGSKGMIMDKYASVGQNFELIASALEKLTDIVEEYESRIAALEKKVEELQMQNQIGDNNG
jgi:polyhydroxyalkanoate synthesis regulator phasin